MFAFPGFSKQENVTMRELHKQLLSYAMKKNNHKEVAFILSSDLKNLQTIKGEENSIDISASVDSLLREHENIQILHNHPWGTSFSLRDIYLLLEYENIQGISLITNSGRVETLQKTTNYDRITAGKIVFDVISGVKGKKISRTAVAKKALLALIRGGHIIWKM